jgi:hypothetical protein
VLLISPRSAIAVAAAASAVSMCPPATARDRQASPYVETLHRGVEIRHGHHAFHRRPRHREAATAPERAVPRNPEIDQLRADMDRMRRELDAVRARVEPWPANPGVFLFRPPQPSAFGARLESPPDLRLPDQAPVVQVPQIPPSAPLPRASEEVDRVREARAYLVRTATIGYTMARQTPEVAIGRLHPAFAVRLAEAVRLAREAGLRAAGVFSAYRPPFMGIGGFSNKFNSLHSYGLAADVAGIGGAGSTSARLWQRVVSQAGLFLPYGPNNGAEFNHTQLIPNKVAARHLHGTISSHGPEDLRAMWLASGVSDYVPRASTASRLPDVSYP